MPAHPLLKAMQEFIARKSPELSAIARRRGVAQLDLFGSAATGAFDSQCSDLDFVVRFVNHPPGGMADAYFGLLEDLERLFGRKVDLVVDRSIRNPYFRQRLDASRQPVYAA